jgi:serine/threonine-protein kinase SRPK3
MIHVPDEIALNYALPHVTTPERISSESGGYNIIRTQPIREIYLEKGYNLMNVNIALSDWGAACFFNRHRTEAIQPVLLRAPEVLIGASW